MKWRGPMRACAWLLGAVFLPAVFSSVTNGQEPSRETSAENGPAVITEEETDDQTTTAADDSTPKRPLLKKIAPKLTPAQEEEAERLKKLAAKYGTDPTAIVSRLQISSQYLDLVQGARTTATVARVDLAFRRNFILRVDAAFLRWLDLNRLGLSNTQGLGDLSALAGWRIYNTPEYAVLIGVASTFPTADERTLGLGKYTTGPLIATARFLPRLDSFLFGVFQHQTSVGGDPGRQGVELSRVIGQVNTIWAEKWWTIVQAVWQVDWERNRKSSMALEFEVGRSLVGRLGMFVRPGVGIWGRDVIGAYEWNIEGGIRYMFPSF